MKDIEDKHKQLERNKTQPMSPPLRQWMSQNKNISLLESCKLPAQTLRCQELLHIEMECNSAYVLNILFFLTFHNPR